jgi:hypothetical protein
LAAAHTTQQQQQQQQQQLLQHNTLSATARSHLKPQTASALRVMAAPSSCCITQAQLRLLPLRGNNDVLPASKKLLLLR